MRELNTTQNYILTSCLTSSLICKWARTCQRMSLYNRGISVVFWFSHKSVYKKGYDVRRRIILWVSKVFIGIYFAILYHWPVKVKPDLMLLYWVIDDSPILKFRFYSSFHDYSVIIYYIIFLFYSQASLFSFKIH